MISQGNNPKNEQELFDEQQKHIRTDLSQSLKDNIPDLNCSTQEKLALACKKLAVEGHSETLAGQVTVKAEQGLFWTNPLAGGFQSVKKETVIKIDERLKVIDGKGIPNPGVRFHMWIYQARSDVNAIVHTHPPYASALSMLGKELVVAHMDAAMFYEDCAYLPYWPGVPIADEEGRIISEALGDKRSILLANHGILTVGGNLEEATYLAVQLERAARLQLRAESVGTVTPISKEHAQEAHDFLLQKSVIFGTFMAWCNEIIDQDNGISD